MEKAGGDASCLPAAVHRQGNILRLGAPQSGSPLWVSGIMQEALESFFSAVVVDEHDFGRLKVDVWSNTRDYIVE